MYKKLLQQINLTSTQAAIMEYLFSVKESRASTIASKIKRSRAIVYRDLEELIGMKLIEKKQKNNQATVFIAEHPIKLEKLIEKREKEIRNNKKELANFLPDLVSVYNMAHNRPGVKFYEGEEGVKKVLKDTLDSKTEILTIADSQSVKKTVKKINEDYVKKRKKKGIKKRLIAPESAKERFSGPQDEYTEVRFLNDEDCSFKTGLQIYDGKISYQTLDVDNKIGVIIEDKNIYEMHRVMFDYIWNNL